MPSSQPSTESHLGPSGFRVSCHRREPLCASHTPKVQFQRSEANAHDLPVTDRWVCVVEWVSGGVTCSWPCHASLSTLAFLQIDQSSQPAVNVLPLVHVQHSRALPPVDGSPTATATLEEPHAPSQSCRSPVSPPPCSNHWMSWLPFT